MINPAELSDKEKKITLEELNERIKNQRKTLAMLQEKHKEQLDRLIDEISSKLRTDY